MLTTKFCKLRKTQVSVEMKAVQGLELSSPQEYVENACLGKEGI